MMKKNAMFAGFVTAAAAFAVTLSLAAQTRVPARAADKPGGALFTEEQARKGEAVYMTSCSACHTLTAGAAAPSAGSTTRIALGGQGALRKWRTVGDLFSKVHRTMPANNAGGLTNDAYLDVVAFLLQTNGATAGRTPLTANTAALHQMLVPGTPALGTVATDLTDKGFFTEAQAQRGAAYFDGNCTTCHVTSPEGRLSEKQVAEGKRGVFFGGDYRPWPVTGQNRLQRWGSAWALYNKIRQSMPAHDPGGLSQQTYVDIAAFILQALGAPAGAHELPPNPGLLRAMTTNEPGFERIFNGKDFTGIKAVLGTNCRPKPAGCAQTDPSLAFAVEDGNLVAKGTPEGYWYYDAKYLDFTLRFDFRWDPVEGLERQEEQMSNSGYLLFITDHGIWPKSIEVQGASGGEMGAFGVAAQVKATSDDEARRRVLRPVGQWNSAEIVSKNGVVTASLNGTLITTVTEHEFKAPGYIGFQSEGGVIRWRNLRIRREGATATQ